MRDAITLADDTVALFPAADLDVDVDRFDALEQAASTASVADAEAAIAVYGGDLLPDDLYEEWALEPRERRRLRFLELLRQAERWEALVAADATDEDAHLHMVRSFMERDRAGALRQLDFLDTVLRRELGVEPGGVAVALREQVLAMPVEPIDVLADSLGRVVAVPRPARVTIGRYDEIAGVGKLLDEAPIVTLLGPGGVGKTRLASEVALRRARSAVSTHALWISHGARAELVPGLIVRDLGVHLAAESDSPTVLDEVLRGRAGLLVLDNFEHVVDAAPIVGQIIGRAPDLRVLVTSRTRLRIAGETVFDVEPLATEAGADRVADAVRLFAQTATAIDPGFELDAHLADVTEICRTIDGLPLAIELAAGHVRTLPPVLLRTRLHARLGSASASARDAPDRQLTMPATIDWSLQLLGDPERELFVRLGVFESGVPLEPIEEVCAEPGVDVIDALGRLVDQSLVKRTIGRTEPRFVLLELLRERARDLLGDETEVMRGRHADYVRRFVADVDERRWRELSGSWIDRISGMLAEIRAAHAFAVERDDVELAAHLTAGLGTFWHREGHHAEGHTWVDHALAHAGALDEWLRHACCSPPASSNGRVI